MTALDVLNEYKTYIKIVARRNGKTLDIEKAQIIIDALKKQIKTPPIDTTENGGKYGKCPCCDAYVSVFENILVCDHCGQALDWGAADG